MSDEHKTIQIIMRVLERGVLTLNPTEVDLLQDYIDRVPTLQAEVEQLRRALEGIGNMERLNMWDELSNDSGANTITIVQRMRDIARAALEHTEVEK